MKTKNYFLLVLAFALFSTACAASSKENDKKKTVLEQLHWLIERSSMQDVRVGFESFCKQNDFPSMVRQLKDGVYKGASPEDDYGYRHEVTFEMKGGMMVSIDYDEIHKDGHAKQHDKEYCKQMLESGTTPAIAYPSYESQMLEKQDYNKVDGISGASYSLYRFRLAILYAMLNAKQLK
jgi:major membrane immunogen (membrane-anchored lipoprotein)